MATTNSTGVSLKLFIDTKSRKVLYAEANKEVVDFLFTSLSLHVATVTRLLSGDGMVGCVGNLYQSVETLSVDGYLPSNHKDSLLKPKTTIVGTDILQLATNKASNQSDPPGKLYICTSCYRFISNSYGFTCLSCGYCKMPAQFNYVSPPASAPSNDVKGGYVKDGVIYMIKDDLEVKPMTTASSLAVLQKSNVKEVDAIQLKVVDLGMLEGLKLVKASLESNASLTNVFLGDKPHKHFNFGPRRFWMSILACGFGLVVLFYIGVFCFWSFDLIGINDYTAWYCKNNQRSPEKPICYPSDPFALSLIHKL